jgi:K+-sensing histidine kinase KdpD
LSKADAGSLTLSAAQVNISDMLGELVMDANMFQDKLKIISNIQKAMYWYCDMQLIQQLFHNLYTNAVNYNIENGWIHFEAKMDRHELVVVFSNPTPKMSHDVVERAFERFYRGIDSHTRLIDGHGLGLSLCREIARVHYAELEMVEDDQNVVKVTLRVNPKALMQPNHAPVAHLLETA